MLRIEKIEELRAQLGPAREAGSRIGFVPTMGAFHEGHLTLLRKARSECDLVVASIFVNPMQFDRRHDFQSYPRQEASDEELAEKVGVGLLFVPTVEEMYPDGFRTRVYVEELGDLLCGAVREGHFSGVATVVAKFFNLIEPDAAYFGEKDFQQLVIVRRMVSDLNMRIRIEGIPTVRESDGLAMSSRNQLLSSAERQAATVLWRSLSMAEQMVTKGETDVKALVNTMRRMIGEEPVVRLEYLNVVDPDTLRDVGRVSERALVALAAQVGTTRLIDNVLIEREG